MSASFLNINQSADTLDSIWGEQDYYWYLESEEFREAFHKPIADIVNRIGNKCLDVGCGVACLADYVTVPYEGIDGSEEAIAKALKRLDPKPMWRSMSPQNAMVEGRKQPIWLMVKRMEELEPLPILFHDSNRCTLVFSGILEVLIDPSRRLDFLQMYEQNGNASHLIICDLERLDTYPIEAIYGEPTIEIHLEAKRGNDPRWRSIEEVKLKRKVLVYEC